MSGPHSSSAAMLEPNFIAPLGNGPHSALTAPITRHSQASACRVAGPDGWTCLSHPSGGPRNSRRRPRRRAGRRQRGSGAPPVREAITLRRPNKQARSRTGRGAQHGSGDGPKRVRRQRHPTPETRACGGRRNTGSERQPRSNLGIRLASNSATTWVATFSPNDILKSMLTVLGCAGANRTVRDRRNNLAVERLQRHASIRRPLELSQAEYERDPASDLRLL